MGFSIKFPDFKRHVLTFSYDDGEIHDRRLIEMFNKYNVKATFHLNSARVKSDDACVNEDEIATLYKGHEVAIHTVTHPIPSALTKTQMINEIIEDRRYLESLVRYPVRGCSYPYGVYFKELKDTLKALGIEYSRTASDMPYFGLPSDYLEWNPSCHHSGAMNLADRFLDFDFDKNLTLLYIWGHSFEFARQNNWELMEEILQKLSGHKEVWYATNIEIKDYLDAARGLKVTLDEKIIYNPSSIPVYIEANGKQIVIGGGETITL